MTNALLDRVVALTRPAERAAAAADLAARLGGRLLVVFVLDEEVGLLLPAPGFAQTLPGARAWRRFVARCAAEGEASTPGLQPPDRGPGAPPEPAYGVGGDDGVAAVVLGTAERARAVTDLRALLPLLGATLRGERAAAHAATQARLARQAAAHAEALAATLDRTRGEVQRALAEAQRAARALEAANRKLQDQAGTLAAQAAELEAQADDLRRTNEALVAARDAAEAASRAKSQFLATMSHELRTPLNAIGGHVQLVELGLHGPVTPAQLDALARVQRSQRHLLGLINDILNLARIESGRVDYHLATVRLADVLADLRPMIEPQLLAKGLAYEVHADVESAAVCADREKLQQVMLNLLSNAVKFTERGGAVTVTCARRADAPGLIFLRVSDTGIGVPPEKMDGIFEPFVQVDSSHSRLGQGTGLGLAISRDLARGMGGDLRVRSEPGKGSTFTLTLPTA